MSDRPLIAVTMGDPAGIGPEVVAKAASVADVRDEVDLWVYGDVGVLAQVVQRCGLDLEVDAMTDAEQARSASPKVLPVRPGSDLPGWNPGQPSSDSDAAQLRYVEEAIASVKAGEVAALATAPIHKMSWSRAGSPFAGHTDLLGARFQVAHPVMMLAGPSLRVVPLTVHIPLRDVPQAITRSAVEQSLRVIHDAFQSDFGLSQPRIAVAGLNPHAGESGLFGQEEQTVLEPALKTVQAEGIAASGPFPADSIFKRAVDGEFDVVLGMYHDQALTPLKLLDFDRAVNVTLGLPAIRTSVDHGTAYDIASQGVASAASMIEAVRLAGRMARSRMARSRQGAAKP